MAEAIEHQPATATNALCVVRRAYGDVQHGNIESNVGNKLMRCVWNYLGAAT